MTVMDTPLIVQTEHSHTLELLSLMVLWTMCPDKRYDIIVRSTHINLTQSYFCRSPLTLEVVYMMTLSVCFFCIHIVIRIDFGPDFSNEGYYSHWLVDTFIFKRLSCFSPCIIVLTRQFFPWISPFFFWCNKIITMIHSEADKFFKKEHTSCAT